MSIAWTVPEVQAQGQNSAIVVIDFGDRKEQVCVYFDGDYITARDALTQAAGQIGASVILTPQGAVCKIGSTGCDYPGEDCFCKSYTPPYYYWSYWRWGGGTWTYSSVGVEGRKLYNGDADGWSWVVQTPPAPDFGRCQAAAPTATSTPSRTPTATPTTTRRLQARRRPP